MANNTQYENQKILIDVIDKVVERKLSMYNNTTSTFGVLIEDPKEFVGKVKIVDDIYTCTIPEYLHTWLQKDDVVIVQDLFNDGRKKTIIGKTGKTRVSDPSLVFYRDGHNRYGVDGVFEVGSDEKLGYATVDESGVTEFPKYPDIDDRITPDIELELKKLKPYRTELDTNLQFHTVTHGKDTNTPMVRCFLDNKEIVDYDLEVINNNQVKIDLGSDRPLFKKIRVGII